MVWEENIWLQGFLQNQEDMYKQVCVWKRGIWLLQRTSRIKHKDPHNSPHNMPQSLNSQSLTDKDEDFLQHQSLMNYMVRWLLEGYYVHEIYTEASYMDYWNKLGQNKNEKGKKRKEILKGNSLFLLLLLFIKNNISEFNWKTLLVNYDNYLKYAHTLELHDLEQFYLDLRGRRMSHNYKLIYGSVDP